MRLRASAPCAGDRAATAVGDWTPAADDGRAATGIGEDGRRAPLSPAAILAGLALLLLALLPFPALAQSFPAFTGYVVDTAHVIPADTAAQLTAKLEALDKTTHRQLVVATVPDLQGYAIEDYGYRLGRAWGVGLKGANTGAILLIAPKEHKVRIEVGYGLEPVLTDALSSVIIQTQIVPRFKAGDMPGGIVAGTQAIIDQLAAPDAEAKAKADAAYAQQQKQASSGDATSFAPLIFWGFIILVVILARLRKRATLAGTRSSRFGGAGASPIWLWAAMDALNSSSRSSGGGWGSGGGFGGGGGGFSGGGGGSFGGGGASGGW